LVGLFEEGPPWGQRGRRGGESPGWGRERRRSSVSLILLLRLRWTRQVCLATWIQEREMAFTAFTPSATTRVRLYLLHSLTGGFSSSRRPLPRSGPRQARLHTVLRESQRDREHPFLPPLNFTYFPSTITYLKSPLTLAPGSRAWRSQHGQEGDLSTSPSSLSNSSTPVLTLSPVQHG